MTIDLSRPHIIYMLQSGRYERRYPEAGMPQEVKTKKQDHFWPCFFIGKEGWGIAVLYFNMRARKMY